MCYSKQKQHPSIQKYLITTLSAGFHSNQKEQNLEKPKCLKKNQLTRDLCEIPEENKMKTNHKPVQIEGKLENNNRKTKTNKIYFVDLFL